MRLNRLGRVIAAITCAVGLIAAPASAAPTVAITSAVRDTAAGTATVTGTAAFAAITEAQSVGGLNTNFSEPGAADAGGFDLTDAKILPLEDGSGLRFIWQLTSLPAQVPPEGVRYTWAFRIGETQFQLQAKRTNMASITTVEDPVGHARQAAAGEFFQLRGACKDNYFDTPQPVAGCAHLAFLKGSFDATAKTVSMDVPFNTKDSIGRLVAPQFKPGVVIEELQTASMSITAALQAVISNTQVSDYTNGWDPYYVGPRVDLAVGSATASPLGLNFATPATLTGDTFTGTVPMTGSATTVYARACNGMECSFAKLTP
jgi:hypothetical protein